MSDHCQQPADPVIDVREIPRPQRHKMIFGAYQQLAVGQSLELVNDHEPRGLLKEFERELPGSFCWEALPVDGDDHRVRITKRASTALPRVVADTAELPEGAGSIWQLEPGARDLDANIIALAPHDEIKLHTGPELDVVLIVLAGSGELQTELGTSIPLQPGTIAWLPRRAQRRFIAGSDGIRYFSVHQRKPTLNITAAPPVTLQQPGN